MELHKVLGTTSSSNESAELYDRRQHRRLQAGVGPQSGQEATTKDRCQTLLAFAILVLGVLVKEVVGRVRH